MTPGSGARSISGQPLVLPCRRRMVVAEPNIRRKIAAKPTEIMMNAVTKASYLCTIKVADDSARRLGEPHNVQGDPRALLLRASVSTVLLVSMSAALVRTKAVAA